MTDIIKILRDGAKLIERAGLARYVYRADDPDKSPQDCPHCTMGALLEVALPNSWPRLEQAPYFAPEMDGPAAPAIQAVSETLRLEGFHGYGSVCGRVSGWNDAPGRTAQEVADLLNRTADRLEA